jgi:uncharacterized membrane protein (UPF0127 family)
METIQIMIGNKPYILDVSETEEDRYEGLSADMELPDNEGMVFVFDEEGPHPMVMRGMEFPLDIIHITQEGVVTAVATGNPDDTMEFAGDTGSMYVIELAAGEAEEQGIRIASHIKLPAKLTQYIADRQGIGMAKNGGTPTLKEGAHVKKYNVQLTDIPELPDHLQVLDDGGKVISNIKLGARIFSQPHTKMLIEAAQAGDDPESLKKLGQMMVDMIHKQDTQPPEYSN